MKIVKYILTLLINSFVFGSEFIDTNDELIDIDINDEMMLIDSKCINELDGYLYCFKKFTDETSIPSACEYYKKDGCYDFYLFPKEEVIPEACIEAQKKGLTYDFINRYEYYEALMKLFCETNTKGKPCAASTIYFKSSILSDSEVYKIVDENCSSQRCNVAFVKYLAQEYKYATDRKQFYKDLFNYAQSDKCLSKYEDNKTTKAAVINKSLTTTIKVLNSNKATTTKASVLSKAASTIIKASNTKTATTTKASNTKVSISTVKDRCGTEFGGRCANANYCCSKYNYCGTSDEHCGAGCQSQFGTCLSNRKATFASNANTNAKYSVSTIDFRCGPEYGKCSGDNQCCSKYNYCGTSDEYCGNGCQSEFGICNTKSSNSSIPISENDRCGPQFGKCADSNECCSQYGYCGTTNAHCSTGCQPKYGLCK